MLPYKRRLKVEIWDLGSKVQNLHFDSWALRASKMQIHAVWKSELTRVRSRRSGSHLNISTDNRES